MINFNDYYYFASVVEHQGITAASKALNLPKSKLSKRISDLENALGTCLIQRTSRTFFVTDIGNEFYRHARNIIIEAHAAESTVKSRLGTHRGKVRICVSPLVNRLYYGKIVADFLRNFPEVHLVQEILPSPADIAAHKADIFVVAHDSPLEDSSMIGRQLLAEPKYLVAAPEYLSASHHVSSPNELTAHDLLIQGEMSVTNRWNLANERTRENFSLCFKPRFAGHDFAALLDILRAGGGIGALPAPLCRTYLEQGELIAVLPDWIVGQMTITALLPSGRSVPPEVRSLLDHLAAGLAGRRKPLGRHAAPAAAVLRAA